MEKIISILEKRIHEIEWELMKSENQNQEVLDFLQEDLIGLQALLVQFKQSKYSM